MSAHRHRFRVAGWCVNRIEFRCRCGEERERKMDRAEQRRHQAEWQDDGAHRVWHDFQRRFQDKKTGSWKYSGYDLIKRVERWVKKWPGEVRLVSCDDDHFSSSLLVLVEHRAESRYMGTTCVFLPQCSGGPPAEFFLYPGHRAGLLDALQAIEREARPRQKCERQKEAESARWWAARPITQVGTKSTR